MKKTALLLTALLLFSILPAGAAAVTVPQTPGVYTPPYALSVAPEKARYTGSEDVVFVVTAGLGEHTAVLIDGATVPRNKYIVFDATPADPLFSLRAMTTWTGVFSGIRFNSDYLATLADGTYGLVFRYGVVQGYATLEVERKTATSSPENAYSVRFIPVGATVTGRASVYASMEEGEQPRRTFSAGAQITLVQLVGRFALVEYAVGGKTYMGYMPLGAVEAAFMSVPRAETTGKTGMYKKKTDAKSALTATRAGVKFDVVELQGEWAKVLYKDTVYYVRTANLSFYDTDNVKK